MPPPALAVSPTSPTADGATVVEIVPLESAVIVQAEAPQAANVPFVADKLTLTPTAGPPVSPSAICTENGIAAARPAYDPLAGCVTT